MLAYALFLVTGLIFSMVGLGGGSVFVPFFTFLGYDLKTIAVPAGIFLVWVTAISSSINYVRHQQVRFSLAWAFLSGSLFTSALGHLFLYRSASSKTLMILLGVVVLISGLRFLLLPENFGVISLESKKMKGLLFFIGGVVVGFISVMTGVGGGFLMVPFMLHFGVSMKEAVGTSSFVIAFTSALGFLTHFFSTFDQSFFSRLLLYAGVVFIGGFLGSKIHVAKLKSKQVKWLMGIVLTGLAVYLWIKEWM